MDIKTIIISILNAIHQKLKTKEGQLSLIIAASLIVGASAVTVYLKEVRIAELTADKLEKVEEIKENELEIKSLKADVKAADIDCNNKILRNVVFQKELKDALDGKIKVNTEIVNEKLPLLKEEQELIKDQQQTVLQLKQLNNKL